EVLESLPHDHPDYAAIADEEAKAHLALGFTQRALQRYEAMLDVHKAQAEAEAARGVYHRQLSVSYNKLGHVHTALGQGDKARDAYLNALHIREHLADAEPDHSDYQRDLSISYERM